MLSYPRFYSTLLAAGLGVALTLSAWAADPFADNPFPVPYKQTPADPATRWAGFQSRVGTFLPTDPYHFWRFDPTNRAEVQDAPLGSETGSDVPLGTGGISGSGGVAGTTGTATGGAPGTGGIATGGATGTGGAGGSTTSKSGAGGSSTTAKGGAGGGTIVTTSGTGGNVPLATVGAEAVGTLCRQFDRAKIEMFDPADVERGFFRATDRRGQEVEVPLVTLSVAVVPCEAAQTADHPGALAQMAASLKRKVKEMTSASRRSEFLFERRKLRQCTSG